MFVFKEKLFVKNPQLRVEIQEDLDSRQTELSFHKTHPIGASID